MNILIKTKDCGIYDGIMSQKTYNNIPCKKPKLIGKYFGFGDLVKKTLNVEISDDKSLEENVLYLTHEAKSIYYPEVDRIDWP